MFVHVIVYTYIYISLLYVTVLFKFRWKASNYLNGFKSLIHNFQHHVALTITNLYNCNRRNRFDEYTISYILI